MRRATVTCLVLAMICAITAGVIANQNAELRRQVLSLERVRARAHDDGTQILGCIAHIKADVGALRDLSGPLAERHEEELHRRITAQVDEAEQLTSKITSLAENPTRPLEANDAGAS